MSYLVYNTPLPLEPAQNNKSGVWVQGYLFHLPPLSNVLMCGGGGVSRGGRFLPCYWYIYGVLPARVLRNNVIMGNFFFRLDNLQQKPALMCAQDIYLAVL